MGVCGLSHTRPRHLVILFRSVHGHFPLLAIEKPELLRPPSGRSLRDAGPREVGNGLVALIFSASGPIAVILAGRRGRQPVA